MTDAQDTVAVWSDVAAAWDARVDYVNDHAAAATGQLVDAVAVQPGERVVELAGGPGTLGARWSELVGDEGSVLVSDFSPAMLAAAERRLAGLDNVSTARLDLAAIDLPDASADVAVCRFGLMFVPEPERALAEVHRILASGGRVGAMTWAGFEHNPWVAMVGMAMMVNGLTTGGPPVGPGELFSLADPELVARLAAGAGFEQVSVEEAALDFTAPDIESHVQMVAELAGPLATVFRTATPDQLEAVRSTVAGAAEEFATDDGYVMPGRALILTANRP